MTLPDAALRAIDAGALVAINDSGGKDSAAQGIVLSAVVPPEQRLFIHASLGESEWPGALEQARTHAQTLGGTFTVVRARRTFLQMVVRRFQERPEVPCWPSPAHRQCTSDLKTNVINSAVIAHARAGGYTRVVSALGLRAEESRRRAQKATCAVHPKLDLKGRLLKSGEVRGRREWLTLLPIHAMNTEEVFGTIADAGMAPHPAYGLGNERVSCVLCIMAARCDLANGARHHPALYQRYAAVEYLTGWAMSSSRKTLPELTGVPLNVAWAEQFRGRLDELAQPQT